MSEPPTLYEWAAGRPAIARLIDCFYDRVERDDLLSPFSPGGVSEEHREHVTTWWCDAGRKFRTSGTGLFGHPRSHQAATGPARTQGKPTRAQANSLATRISLIPTP